MRLTLSAESGRQRFYDYGDLHSDRVRLRPLPVLPRRKHAAAGRRRGRPVEDTSAL